MSGSRGNSSAEADRRFYGSAACPGVYRDIAGVDRNGVSAEVRGWE
jgi:hypothetical protein